MDITEGSGNIFADLGLPDPEVRLMKARLAGRIQDAIEARGWTPGQVAEALSLSETDASRLARGVLRGLSVAQLTEFLAVVEGAA